MERRVIDRLPPQSLEAEQSVLGAMLIDRDAVIEVAEFLRPADFYRQANGRIYAAVLDLFERREPIDDDRATPLGNQLDFAALASSLCV